MECGQASVHVPAVLRFGCALFDPEAITPRTKRQGVGTMAMAHSDATVPFSSEEPCSTLIGAIADRLSGGGVAHCRGMQQE
jgi:hypothetical protein